MSPTSVMARPTSAPLSAARRAPLLLLFFRPMRRRPFLLKRRLLLRPLLRPRSSSESELFELLPLLLLALLELLVGDCARFCLRQPSCACGASAGDSVPVKARLCGLDAPRRCRSQHHPHLRRGRGSPHRRYPRLARHPCSEGPAVPPIVPRCQPRDVPARLPGQTLLFLFGLPGVGFPPPRARRLPLAFCLPPPSLSSEKSFPPGCGEVTEARSNASLSCAGSRLGLSLRILKGRRFRSWGRSFKQCGKTNTDGTDRSP